MKGECKKRGKDEREKEEKRRTTIVNV